MALAFIPPIGTAGIYSLAAPFNTDLLTNTSYRCDAARRFSDFIELGTDPFEEFYVPKGLTQDQYNQDVINQVVIISLVSSSNHWVHVPSTYVLALPDINGVAYAVTVLGMEMGAIPNYMDLTGLKSALADLAHATIGIRPAIKEAVISAVEKVSQADHDALEAARQQAITNSTTDRARLITLQQQYDTLKGQYDQLEAYVKTLV